MSIIGGTVLATLGVMLASNAETVGKAAMLAFIFILEGAGILSSGRTLYRTLDKLRNRMFYTPHIPTSFLLLPSSFFLLPSSFFLHPSSFILT
jgi:hypothetical protein